MDGRLSESSDVFMSLLVECVGADGRVKWREVVRNLVTTEGKNDLLTKYFKGSSYTAAWFMLLKGTGSPAAGDTLASHAGWSEPTQYARYRLRCASFSSGSGRGTINQI